jgi:hypothetical protein
MKKNIHYTLLLLSAMFWLSACKDVLDEHTEIINADNTIDVFQKLAAQPNLSKFSDYLRSTGYDKLLVSSQNYTVWAPTNDALATLDASISADPAKLKDFVANHIALTTIAAPKSPSDTLRVQLLNKKIATLIGKTFEEAGVTGNGQFVKNGAIYTIDKPVPTKLNVWAIFLQWLLIVPMQPSLDTITPVLRFMHQTRQWFPETYTGQALLIFEQKINSIPSSCCKMQLLAAKQPNLHHTMRLTIS